MNKKIIINIGYVVNPKNTMEYSGISVAGNKMQYNIMKHIDKYIKKFSEEKLEQQNFTIIPIACYPKDKHILIKKKLLDVYGGKSVMQIPFVNIPIIKQFTQIISLYISLDYAIKEQLKAKNEVVLYTFNLFPQVGIPVIHLAKKYGIKVFSLLADLPIDDAVKRKYFSKIFRKLFDESTKRSIKKTDYLIVLNKNVMQRYANGQEYIVMEGGAECDQEFSDNDSFQEKDNVILYCGAITKYSGILELASSMQYLKSNVILEIYGTGDCVDTLLNSIIGFDNVKYFGKVDNNIVLERQKEVLLLLNPRKIDDPISQVTFPSKIFEYLSSGTPVLSTRLNCFTEEYLDIMYFFEGTDIISMAAEIDRIVTLSPMELQKMGRKAKKFVFSNKTWDVQISKMMEFINEKGFERLYL